MHRPIAGDDVDVKLENLKGQIIVEFVKVHGDIAAMQADIINVVAGDAFNAHVERVDQRMTRADVALAGFNDGIQQVADRLTAMEVSEANTRHLVKQAAANETTLLDKLEVLEGELQRWTAASAEQAGILASMQGQAGSAFAKSMAHLSDGYEAMKTAIELQVNLLKSEVAMLKMAATQASIIQVSSRASGAAAAWGVPGSHGPSEVGSGLGDARDSTAPVRMALGVMAPGVRGLSPCHCQCRHLDQLKDRADAA